jgi:hypothetical protein
MTPQQLTAIIAKLEARRQRQARQLEITESELQHWTSMLDGLRKGK